MDDYESFPRGKPTNQPTEKTLVERKKQKKLFSDESSSSKLSKSKRGKKVLLTGDEEKLLAGKTGGNRKNARNFDMEHLSYETLSPGILSLGRVKKVYDDKLLVSLPGRLAGSLSIEHVSTPYIEALRRLETTNLSPDDVIHSLEDMFQENDCLVVKVLEVNKAENGHHRVILSTDPLEIHSNWKATDLEENLVLTGAVKSVEEHGFILDLGIKGVRAFLPKHSAQTYLKQSLKKLPSGIGIGQLIQVKIVKCKIHRLMANVTVSATPSQVNSATIDDVPNSSVAIGYNLLLPGMQLNATIMDTHDTGVKVHVLNMTGRIHVDHQQDPWKLAKTYKLGDTMKARILYIHPVGCSPYLSFQSGLWPYGTEPKVKSTGKSKIQLGTLEEGLVVSTDNRGVVFKFKNSEKGLLTKQRGTDKLGATEEEFYKRFKTGTRHTCRVLEYSPLDNVYILSCQESMLKEDFVKYTSQISPGDRHTVTIISYNKGGAMVKLCSLKGFIPNEHFGDSEVQNIKLKYPPGRQLKARVFQIDEAKGRIILTGKPQLVKSKGIVLSNYDQVKVGMIGHGVIRDIRPNGGLRISTIGGLTGFAPASKLPRVKNLALEAQFRVGQTVQYEIVKGDPQKTDGNKIIMTLKLTEKAQADEELKNNTAPTKRKASKPEELDSSEPAAKKTKKKKKKNKKLTTTLEKEETQSKAEEEKQQVLTLPSVSNSQSQQFWNLEENTMQVDDIVENKTQNTKTVSVKKKSHTQVPLVDVKPKLEERNKEEDAATELFHERRVTENPEEFSFWLAYKKFALESGDTGRAISVMHRASNKIPFREESTKLKCWTIILELESKYGSEESLKNALREAEKVNDKASVLLRMAKIFDSQDKQEQAEGIYRQLVRVEKNNPDNWVTFGQFCYKHGKAELARKLMDDGINAVFDKDKANLAARFSKLEIELGDKDKGAQLFSGVCNGHFKRTDLWIMFANALFKKGDIQGAINVLSEGLSANKAEESPSARQYAIVARRRELSELLMKQEKGQTTRIRTQILASA